MILQTFYSSLLQFLVLLPFFMIALRAKDKGPMRWPLLAFLLFVITSVTTAALSGVILFEGQQWNWAGKGISLLIALVFILTIKPTVPNSFGLTFKIQTAGAKPIFFVCAVYLLVRIVLYLSSMHESLTFHTETILFQATLPGLEEEIIFRGIILTLLNCFLLQRWLVAGVSTGWAAVLTSLLFGLTHGFFIDDAGVLQFNAFALGRAAFDGFLFALLAEKTRSLVPGIFFHNLLNLIGNH